MAIEIKQVCSEKELKKFIWFGINLYKKSKYAAPPLFFDEFATLKKGKNPALDFCETAYFLAYKEGKIAGRIAAIINPVANKTWNQNYARFGWVDFIDDYDVSKALFDAAINWAKAKGMTAIHGPLGFTDFDHEGMLIDGFDRESTIITIYNYPYYPKHLEKYGFEKDIDWNEYLISFPEVYPEKYFRIADIVKEKYNLTSVNFKKRKEIVDKYAYKAFDLLMNCYSHLYGYSKLNEEQIKFYIDQNFGFLQLDTISVVVDSEDNVVAFGLAMPSLTKALQKAKGSIFPFGWIYLMRALKKNDILDLYLMAVHPSYQSKGVNAIVFADILQKTRKKGYKFAESNPELENNYRMSSQWKNWQHENHKKRRVYIKNI